MAKTSVILNSLNKILPNRTANKETKRRNITSHHRNDKMAAELAKCNSASEIGTLAMKFGLTEQEVRTRAKSAPNFGQYRMVIGNRIRGIVNKILKAKRKSQKLTFADAAYPKSASAPVKKAKKAKKKKKR